MNQDRLCDKNVNEIIRIVDVKNAETDYAVLQFETE